MKNTLIATIFAAHLPLFWACGASKPVSGQIVKPMETYAKEEILPPLTPSNVNVPINFKATDIEQLLNRKITGVIYDDQSFDGDDLKLRATKTQNINIQLSGLTMNYRVPISIWMFKKLFSSGITGVRGLEAEGELALIFRTTLNIQNDWTLKSQTEVVSYEWIKNMALKTGLGNVDVKYIANRFLESSRATLAGSIDKAITESVDLRNQIGNAWQIMQTPIKVSDDYRMWVKITPQNVSMTPLQNAGDKLQSIVTVSGITEVKSGETTPSFLSNTNLPPFQMTNAAGGSDFLVNLTSDIPYSEAERLANKMMVGQVFEPGGKKIRIEKIQLFGQNDKIIVNTTLSGAYNGSVYLIGKPVFNAATNTIELKDVDYELNTRSFLAKSAAWLFDKTIIRKIQESAKFDILPQLTGMQDMLNNMLREYKFNNNVMIQGNVSGLKVNEMLLTKSGIRTYITSSGNLNMNLGGF